MRWRKLPCGQRGWNRGVRGWKTVAVNGRTVRNCHDDKSRWYRISWWRVSRHLHTAETIFFPGYGYAKTGVTCGKWSARTRRGCTSRRYACICRFQRAPLIERTHAATLSCALDEQCRGKKHRSAIKYPSKPS